MARKNQARGDKRTRAHPPLDQHVERLAGFSTGCLYHAHSTLNASFHKAEGLFKKVGADLIELHFATLGEVRAFQESDSVRIEYGHFSKVYLHAPSKEVFHSNLVGWETLGRMQALALQRSISGVIVHPDPYLDYSMLRNSHLPFLFENTDLNRQGGTSLKDIKRIKKEISQSPHLGFAFNAQHAYAHDRSGKLGLEMIAAMGDRLKVMHVSGQPEPGSGRSHGLAYDANNKAIIRGFMDYRPDLPRIGIGYAKNLRDIQAELDFLRR
ncbi:hypothetical protein JW826_06310 [Candidatus Woesearchaeota archaeon]|nr:hypothetical protein [Candidatus Woesearchaeota archaeon]